MQSAPLRSVRYPILILTLLLATWLGARGLNADSYWLDEYASLYEAGGAYFGPLSPAQVWERISTQDPWQSPGYYLLLNQWGAWVGWTEFATRALSLFAGLLAIAWTYRLGRDLISPLGGLAAAVALGTSAYLLYFFHELRPYTLYVLFTSLMVWAYWRLVTRRPRRALYIWLLLGVAGALYTHYFAGLTAVALAVFHLLTWPRFRDRRWLWWRVTAVFIISGLLFVPWLQSFLAGAAEAGRQSGIRGASALSAQDAITGLLYLFSNGSTGLFIVIAALGVQRAFRAALTGFWLLCVLGLLLLINAKFGVILEVRYLMALWPPLAILFGLGFSRVARIDWRVAGGMMAVWVAGGIWISLHTFPGYALHNPQWHLPWRTLRDQITAQVQADDRVIFLLPDWTWAVYHRDLMAFYLHDLPVKTALVEQPAYHGYSEFVSQEKTLVADASRLWVATAPQQPLNYRAEFDQVLADQGFLDCGIPAQRDDLRLDLYVQPPQTTGIQFGTDPQFTLIPMTQLDITTPNPVLNLVAIWKATDPLAANQYSAAFHLENAAGELVAQVDYGVPTYPENCHAVDLPLENLPDGTYTLLTTVYAWETGTRVHPANAAAQPDERVVLGSITFKG